MGTWASELDTFEATADKTSEAQISSALEMLYTDAQTLDASINALTTQSAGGTGITNAQLTALTMQIGTEQAQVEMDKGVLKTIEKLISKAGQSLQQQ